MIGEDLEVHHHILHGEIAPLLGDGRIVDQEAEVILGEGRGVEADLGLEDILTDDTNGIVGVDRGPEATEESLGPDPDLDQGQEIARVRNGGRNPEVTDRGVRVKQGSVDLGVEANQSIRSLGANLGIVG